MKRSFLPAMILVASLSCGKRDAPTRPEPPPPASAPAPSASVSVTASASAAEAKPPPAPVRLAAASIPLHVVASVAHPEPWPPEVPVPYNVYGGPRSVRIHALRDRMLVTGFDLGIYGLEGGKLTSLDELQGERFRVRFSAEDSVFASADSIITEVMGRYPDALYLTVTGAFIDGARIGGPAEHSFAKTGDRFAETPLPVAASAWTAGKTLVLAGGKFSVRGGGEAPRRTAGKACTTRVKAEALAALPDGEVLVPGGDCDAGGRLSVERWAPGSAEGVVVPLGVPEGKLERALVVANERDRFVLARLGGAGFLARLGAPGEEAAVTPIALPTAKGVADAALADDGCLWILFHDAAGTELFRRDASGVFARATFPKAARVNGAAGMYAASCDAVYVAGAGPEDTSVIVSSRAGEIFTAAIPPAAPASSAAAGDAGPGGAPKLLGAGCATPFVVLYAVGKSAPEDYDYPATRDALSGWPERSKYTFVEYRFRGARTLGARAPDAAAAEALAARIGERVKGSRPTPACFQPAELLREVKLGGG